jgi:hypothetical protein
MEEKQNEGNFPVGAAFPDLSLSKISHDHVI